MSLRPIIRACCPAGASPADRVESCIGVDGNGVLDLAALVRRSPVMTARKACRWSPIHAANNETGVIQPVAEIAALVKAAGGILVLDAVQAAGRIPLDISDGYGDYLILSSHKIGGPKGVGAIRRAGPT